MAIAYSLCHPIICFCVHTLLTGPDYLQYIQGPHPEEQRDDHYESVCARELRAELGLGWTPAIQRLVHHIAVLALHFTVRMLDSTREDPESVMSVPSQRLQRKNHSRIL